MKKLLIALLTLTVVGTTAFAADPAIKFSGYLNAGSKIVADGKAKDTTAITYSDDDDSSDGTVGKLTAVYMSDVAGFKVTLKGGDAIGSAQEVLSTGYGWAKFAAVPGLKLYAGKSYDGTFDGVDDKSKDAFDSTGYSLVYTMGGLTAGAGVVVPVAAADPNYVFAAAFDVPDTAKVRFSALTKNAAGESETLDKMIVSANYTAIPNLTISGGYYVENMSEFGTSVKNDLIDGTVKYTMGDLYAQLVVYDYLEREFFEVAPRVGYYVTKNLLVYGQLKYVTEGKDDVTYYSTMKPRAYVQYQLDKASKIWAQWEYNTEKEVSTVLLQYIVSF